MNYYNRYHIKDTDRFDPFHFPKAETEMQFIAKAMSAIPVTGKQEAIISYLKFHTIRTAWVSANPVLADRLSTSDISTAHLESLFDSGKNNVQFILDLESYISKALE